VDSIGRVLAVVVGKEFVLMFTEILPTTSVPDPTIPPVLPPDDPNAPDIGREPSIDPPPTVPDQDAPSDNPRLPPPPGWTTVH
jgi:hypothetical protein